MTKGLSLHLTVGVTSLDRVRTHYIKGNLGLREIGQKIEKEKMGLVKKYSEGNRPIYCKKG